MDFYKESFKKLEYLEKLGECSASAKDRFLNVKIELRFIIVFSCCSESMRNIYPMGLEEGVVKIKAATTNMVNMISLSYQRAERNELVASDLDDLVTSLLKEIELIKPEVDQCYHRMSRSDFYLFISDELNELNACILDNLKDILQYSEIYSIMLEVKKKKLIDAFQRKLLFLSKSFQVARKLNGYLGREIEYAAVKVASFFFHCWISSKMDDENKELPDLSLALNIDEHNHENTALYKNICSPRVRKYNSKDTLRVVYINFLLQQLEEVLSGDASLEIPTTDHRLEILREELKLLRSLPTGAPLQDAVHGISYEHLMGVHVQKAAFCIEILFVGNINDEKKMMTMISNDMLQQVLGRLKLINIFCAMELVNRDEASLVAPIKNQFETLDMDLRLLRAFYIDMVKGDNEEEEFIDILSRMDAVAFEAAPVLYWFYINEAKEDMAEEMICLLPDFLEKINLIKEDIRRIYQRFTSSNFPKTDSYRGTITSLRQLNKLLTKRADTISFVVQPHLRKASEFQIKYVYNKVELLISFLVNFEEQCIEIGELLEIRITNMANEVACVTDPILIRDNTSWICILKFSQLLDEMNLINKEMGRIYEKELMLSSQVNTLGEVIVGFDDAGQEIIEQLVEGPKHLNVISIIGMGGLGKTTLTKKLYNNPKVVEYFHVQAWCCVSQLFQKRQVLLDILGQVVEITGRINQNTTDEDLEKMLFQSLKGRRYLIVMDDIWDIKAWTALRRCFCDDSNGSRIVFTTRLQEIALNVKTRGSIAHLLRFFNDDESLELLQKKLFPRGKCPREELNDVKQISKSCKGLPLAVILMAGVLAKKNKEEWKEVAKSVSRHADGDLQNLCSDVLKLSYQNLPDHLRPCFLYFGGFPEDKEISAKKLMWLWVAEGFTPNNELRSSEKIAEEYLMDLISRSLVTVAGIGYNGGVKTCRIHDLLLEFSLTQAKKEKFSLLLDGKDEPSTPPKDELHQHVDGHIEFHNSNPLTHGKFRVCIYSMLNGFDEWPSSEDVCSLLHFAPTIHMDLISSYVSFIIRSFKFLNVLDLERLLLKDLNCGIELLVQLRLLSVRIQSNEIPASISNISKLETFIVKGVKGEVAVPNTIWSMITLKHLHIDNRASLVWDERDVKDVALDKLETISTPSLSCGDKSRDLICSLFNLRKLKCIFSDVDNCNNFPKLDSLIQLESLKVLFYGRKVSTGNFSFPPNLKKLTLSKFQLPWRNDQKKEKLPWSNDQKEKEIPLSGIETIGKLPNLEVLKLLFRAFDGKEWETRDDEFPKLKYLKLESLDFEQWNVSSEDHFPRLEKLVVHRCKKLEEIPSCFADMNTLQTIEVKWCNLSAANSAQEIFNEQQEMGNESFVVSIYPNLSNQGLASSS